MNELVTYVPLPPMPKKRPRVTKNGTFMPKEYTAWKADVGMLVKAAVKKQRVRFGDRVAMDITFDKNGFLLAVQDSSRDRYGSADIDNLLGAVMDAVQDAGVINNDRDVVYIAGRFA